MNPIQIDGNSVSPKSNLKHRLRKLTDDQLDVIADKRHRLARKIQEASGYAKHDSQKSTFWLTKDEG